MNGWTITKVWQVDHKLVVANTIQEAVDLFKAYMGNDYFDEPHSIQAISAGGIAPADFNALIKKDED